GGGIELLLSGTPVLLAQRETTLRFSARQALILKDNGHGKASPERGGKRLNPRRHVVWRSVESSRKTHDQRSEAVLFRGEPGQLSHRAIDGVALEAGGLQYTDRPSQCAGQVAHRHTDPPLANIESCHASH